MDEQLEHRLPKKLSFRDETGKQVMFGDYFDGTVPVIVTLNYSDCPMLCSLQLDGLVKGLKEVDWTAGKDYRLVTVSLNPEEKPERAHRTKQRYVRQYGRPEAREGWHFLTGSEQNIQAVANAIGFRYGYNEKRDEYVHPAAIVIATPDGTVARYLYGLQYPHKTLSLSLVEASQGKIGGTVDRLILYCFHYDETEGRYAPVAFNIMRLGGGLAVVVLGGVLGSFWIAEVKKKKKSAAKSRS